LSLFGIVNYHTLYVDVLAGSSYVGRSSVLTWHEVKNVSIDDWHTLRNPLTWEYLLNETNKDWHEFQNMTSEEWSSFHNATLKEWQTLQKEAKDEWETLSQETKYKYHAFLNATREEWIEIRQKSENEWENIVNVTEDEWSKWSNIASTEWKKLPNQTDEEFRNIVTGVKDGWAHVNKTTHDAISEAGEEYVNVTNAIKQKAETVVDKATDKLKLHTKSDNNVSNITAEKVTKNQVESQQDSTIVDIVKKKNATRHKILNQTKDSRLLESEVLDHWFHFFPHSTLLPYDWGYGYYAYVIGISAIFMGVIILEGVDTSLMCKAAPSKLNSTYLNVGLLATLVGTMGRVLGDGMITVNALIGLSQYGKYTDFVNSLFVPMLPITILGLYLVRRYHDSLK
jgi:hypothetical protein